MKPNKQQHECVICIGTTGHVKQLQGFLITIGHSQTQFYAFTAFGLANLSYPMRAPYSTVSTLPTFTSSLPTPPNAIPIPLLICTASCSTSLVHTHILKPNCPDHPYRFDVAAVAVVVPYRFHVHVHVAGF